MKTNNLNVGIRFSFLTPTDQVKFEQIFSQGAAAFGGNKISGKFILDFSFLYLLY
jgi:hypothetical protein